MLSFIAPSIKPRPFLYRSSNRFNNSFSTPSSKLDLSISPLILLYSSVTFFLASALRLSKSFLANSSLSRFTLSCSNLLISGTRDSKSLIALFLMGSIPLRSATPIFLTALSTISFILSLKRDFSFGSRFRFSRSSNIVCPLSRTTFIASRRALSKSCFTFLA